MKKLKSSSWSGYCVGLFLLEVMTSASGLETPTHIKAPSTEGLMVEYNSGGWDSQPQMECRDSKEEVVPHSSKSYSQDGDGLFHVKMTLLLKDKPQGNIICYIRKPQSSKGKQINIILADALFHPVHIWLIVFISVLAVILVLIFVLCGTQLHKKTGRCDFVAFLNSLPPQLLCFGCFLGLSSVYFGYRIKVPILGPLFRLYNDWVQDAAAMVLIVTVFYVTLICALYGTVRGEFKKRKMNGKNRQRCNQQNVDTENTTQEMIQIHQ